MYAEAIHRFVLENRARENLAIPQQIEVVTELARSMRGPRRSLLVNDIDKEQTSSSECADQRYGMRHVHGKSSVRYLQAQERQINLHLA
jgi:hypothetical protein